MSTGKTGIPSPAHYQILLSYSKGKLLYVQLQASVKTVAIYDGHTLSLCASNSTLATVYPTLNLSEIGDLPFPSVGMPNIPFVRPLNSLEQTRFKRLRANGSIATSLGGETRPLVYMPGVITASTVDGIDRITGATAGFPPGHIFDQWKFSGFQTFQGVSVATRSEQINYGLREPVKPRTPITWAQLATVPTYSRVYNLTSISSDPLTDSAFDFRTHLRPFANVEVFGSAGSNVPIQVYSYNPHGGSLDEQVAKQHILDQEALADAGEGHIHSLAPSGVLVIGALFFATIGLFAWHRLRHQGS